MEDYQGIINKALEKYPTFKKVYGDSGEKIVIENSPINYGIEFFNKTLPDGSLQHAVNYPDISWLHPNLGGYGIAINQKNIKGSTEEAIFGDMLHGMHDDPEYKKRWNNFADVFKKTPLINNTKHWYQKAVEKGYQDSFDQFLKNDIDGRIRILIQPTDPDYKIFMDEMTPEMALKAYEVLDYMRNGDNGK